jgi:hypothetical protein
MPNKNENFHHYELDTTTYLRDDLLRKRDIRLKGGYQHRP